MLIVKRRFSRHQSYFLQCCSQKILCTARAIHPFLVIRAAGKNASDADDELEIKKKLLSVLAGLHWVRGRAGAPGLFLRTIMSAGIYKKVDAIDEKLRAASSAAV
jgi:hypothetical protein